MIVRFVDSIWRQGISAVVTATLWLVIVNGTVANAGELVTHTIDSKYLAGNLVGESPVKDVVVYLPDGYEQSRQDYPVIYWFPGAEQVQTYAIELDKIDDEFASGRADPSIVVFMPVKTSFRSSAYLSSEVFGDWEGFLSQEVIPLVDNSYRTQANADKRGAMGFSMGGFSAIMLSLLQPNTFTAIGVNDPAITFTSGMVRNSEEYPPGYIPSEDGLTLEEFFGRFPETIEGFNDTSVVFSGYGQIAARLSPNPDHPLRGDIPFDRDGNWLPDVRQAWRDYDLLDPESVELNRESLASLGTLSIILPDTRTRPWSEELIRVNQAAGVAAQGIPFAGDHNDFQHERFTALLSNVSYALRDESRTVLSGDPYQQDFSSLGVDDALGVDLPRGWSVTDGLGFIDRDRTNTAFRGGEIERVGQQPYILNVGQVGSEDRALAVYEPQDSQGSTIQFLADLDSLDANSLVLQFDVEVWDQVERSTTAKLGEAAFQVTIELDFGQGFEQVADLGVLGMQSLAPPVGTVADGNDDLYRASFREVVAAPFGDANAMRIAWSTTLSDDSAEWVFALDGVALAFDFLGDFDGDAVLTARDIDLLSEAVRMGQNDRLYDLNGDGDVDMDDRAHWVTGLAYTAFGDANLDREVDFADLLAVSRGFSKRAGWADGDFDGSGLVGFGDFVMFANNYGSGSAVRSVPEPHTMLGTLSAFFVATMLRRRLPRARR